MDRCHPLQSKRHSGAGRRPFSKWEVSFYSICLSFICHFTSVHKTSGRKRRNILEMQSWCSIGWPRHPQRPHIQAQARLPLWTAHQKIGLCYPVQLVEHNIKIQDKEKTLGAKTTSQLAIALGTLHLPPLTKKPLGSGKWSPINWVLDRIKLSWNQNQTVSKMSDKLKSRKLQAASLL